MERRERAGVNADMVAKWERGVKGISPRYRELLCRLFGVTPDQLGLKNVPSAGAERVPAKVDDQSLVAMLDNAASLLDQLGAAGTALAPHMLRVRKEAVTTRRTMLGLLDPSATDPIGHARATTATVADLEQLAERYQVLYDSADPAALLTSVAAHVRMAQDTLRQNLATEMRRRLLRNLAEVAMLAGQLAADDLGNTMSGRAYYGLALDAAREVADDQLIAIAHGHAAQLAAVEDFTMAALDHVTAGNEHVCPTPAIACWLATIEATIHADRGEHTLARDALDRAHAILDRVGSWAVPALCRHPCTLQLNATTGHVLSRAGAYREACKELLAALDQSHPIPRRQRVLILIPPTCTAATSPPRIPISPRLLISCTTLPMQLVQPGFAHSVPPLSGP